MLKNSGVFFNTTLELTKKYFNFSFLTVYWAINSTFIFTSVKPGSLFSVKVRIESASLLPRSASINGDFACG